MTATRQALVGAGGNLGDRLATLTAAIGRLRDEPGVEVVGTSAVYETKPVGLTDQPMFLNLVIGIETTLTPEKLLERLLAIEQAFGRIRAERWGPRTLDLDLLAFEDETRATSSLQLPHPRLLERAFVTVPLSELLAKKSFQRKYWDDLRGKIGMPGATRDVKRVAELGN